MKAFLGGVAAMLVVAIGAYFVLAGIQEPVSQRYAAQDSVKLDAPR